MLAACGSRNDQRGRVARLIKGFASGRATIVDLVSGADLIRVLNVIAGIGGLVPVAGPLLGAVVLQLSNWRITFWTVAAFGVAMLLAVLIAVPETLGVHLGSWIRGCP